MEDFREWGHKLIDWVADYLAHPERYPVLPAVRPNNILNALPPTGPERGESMETIFRDFERIILPGITHWNHPKFLAYFAITSSPPSILAELLIAALNANAMIWQSSPAATELELAVIRWLLDWFGLPTDWFGTTFDTASTSTLHAIAAARVRACPELRDQGAPNNLIVYVSEQAHNSGEKGAMALGFGRNHVRRIASDAEFRMRPDLLAETIRQDRANGLVPCCIIATVGTTSTTSIDPVPAIADIAGRENVWLHIDASYAAPAALAPEFRWILAGCERADSLVFNPHKWLLTSIECSVFFCRDRASLRRAFSLGAEFLETRDAGLNFMDYGIPLGHRFRALKLWFVLRYYGREGIAQIIREQIAMTRELHDRIAADPRFEICAPCHLSVICFRMKGSDERNRALVETINKRAEFFLSSTALHGRFVIRIAVGNIATTRQTLENLWLRLSECASVNI